MKTKHLLLLVSVAAFCSCSSAFRTGQTPDDVYYSPAPPPPVEYVTTENQQDKDGYAYNNTYNSEDLAIRRGINDPRYRSNISLDFGYGGYSPYDYYGSPFYSPYSSFYNPYAYNGVTFYSHNYNYYGGYSPYNNYYYSPFNNNYYPPVYISSPLSNYSGPRTYNLGVYNNTANTNRINARAVQSTTNTSMPVRTFTPQATTGSNAGSNRSNRSSGVGNFIRRVFTPSDNNNRSYSNDNARSYRNDNNNNNNSSPARTTQSNTSSGSSGSSSSGSSGSAPVRTFR